MNIPHKTLLTVLLSCPLLPWAHAGGGGKAPAKSDRSTPPPSDTGKWRWNVQAGAAYRHFGGVDFQSGSLSSAALLPALRPRLGGGLGNRSTIGSATDFADRTYQDGFVFKDDDTTRLDSFLPGTTAYWGYQSASQVQGGSLHYRGGTTRSSQQQESEASFAEDWSGDLDGFAPVLELEALRLLTPHLSLGGTFGFMFTSLDAAHSATTFRASRQLTESALSVTDSYDLQGVIPPAAPYAGTFTHPGTAPLIDNIPSRRTQQEVGADSQSATFFNTVDETFGLDLSTLSLGPTLQWEQGRLSFTGRLGLALNIARWKAGAVERLYQDSGGTRTQLRRWDHHSSGTDVLPGFFLQAAAAYQFHPAWSISVFGRRDWSETLRGTVGPSSFSADLSGYTVGAVIVKTF
jgi:hypothetical protein